MPPTPTPAARSARTSAADPATTPPPTPAGRATAPPALTLKAGTSWSDAWRRCLAVAPEAFRDDRVLNLWGAAW
jgi:hypothetical protein